MRRCPGCGNEVFFQSHFVVGPWSHRDLCKDCGEREERILLVGASYVQPLSRERTPADILEEILHEVQCLRETLDAMR